MNTKTKILILLALFFGTLSFAKSSLAADLSIPDDRRVDWQGNVGVPGGIPTVTANCETAACNTLYGGNVTIATISAAIDSAINKTPPFDPSRITVVRIPAGTWDLGSGGIQINRGNVILRGAGKNQTILKSSNTGYFMMTNGSGSDYGPQGSVLDGYQKGSTSVTLDNASAFSVSDFMYLTQDSEPFMYSDYAGASQLFKQLVYVTNVSGNTVSFSPPLAYGLSASLHPKFQHYYGIKQTVPIIGYIGIEDLKIDLSGAAESAAAIWFVDVHAPWIKNVEIANFGDQAVLTNSAVQGTITGCDFINPQPGREGHGVYLYRNTSGFLVENNYSSGLWSTVLGANIVSSVVAYNYAYDTYSSYTGNWQVQSFNTQHEPHEMMDLWEGNVGEQFQNDGYHGSGSHQTIFRNWIHGVSPRGFITNRKIMDLDRWSYWHNVIGNVLGDASWTPTGYEMSGNNCSYTSCQTIYRLGYPNMGNNWYVPGNPPGGSTWPDQSNGDGGLDPQVQATLVRQMNYDYFNKSVRTCDEESEGCQGVTGTTLPASLYMSQKPSWWCDESPWPAIGPDVAGYHGKIPAQIAFEGGKCTLSNSGGDTTAPSAPSGLSVQ